MDSRGRLSLQFAAPLFARHNTKPCNNPSVLLRNPPPFAQGRLGLHFGKPSLASLVQREVARLAVTEGLSPLPFSLGKIGTPNGQSGTPVPTKISRCQRQHFTPHSAAFHKSEGRQKMPPKILFHVATGNISLRRQYSRRFIPACKYRSRCSLRR